MAQVWSRRSVRVFFLLGLGVPWIGWSVVALHPNLTPPLRLTLFYTGDFMTVAGLVATYVAGGSPAIRGLLSRCVRCASLGWFAFALLIPLTWEIATRIVYGLTHGGVGVFHALGIAAYVAPAALVALTTGPLGEELGWRGFLLPRLLTQYTPLSASVILGVIWGLWHFPLYIHANFAHLESALAFVTGVVCFSIIMTYLFLHTRGSLLLAILFHWSVNVAPDAANQMLPAQLGAVDSWGPLWDVGFTVLTALVILIIMGPPMLRRSVSLDPEREFAGEAVARDAPASALQDSE